MWKWNIFHSTCAIPCVVPQCSFCCTALLWHGRVSKPPALGRWAPITHWGWHRVCEMALQIPGQHVQPSGISPLSFRPAALHKPHDAFEWQIQHWSIWLKQNEVKLSALYYPFPTQLSCSRAQVFLPRANKAITSEPIPVSVCPAYSGALILLIAEVPAGFPTRHTDTESRICTAWNRFTRMSLHHALPVTG